MQHEQPPCAITAEEGILAHLLYNPRSIEKVIGSLLPEHFYRNAHQMIYATMIALHSKDMACTMDNVYDELERCKHLGSFPDGARTLLDVLYDSLEYLTPLSDHVRKVKYAWLCRQIIFGLPDIAGSAYRQDDDVVEKLEQLAYSISLGVDSKSVVPLGEVLDRYMTGLDKRRTDFEEGIVTGIPTGFTELDRMLGGMRASRLYTLAGLTGGGKTAYALNIALYIAKHLKHVLFFSAEMDDDEIAERILSVEAEIPQEFLRDGNVNQDQYDRLKDEVSVLSDCDFKLDDRTYLLADIRSKALSEHGKKPLDLIVVDYLQLLNTALEGRGKNESRAEEVAKISKDLKRLARDLKVPILALAQMNRESQRRANDLPQLSDLGESSGVEKNSDVVMFIYCAPTEIEKRELNKPYELSIIIRKHRHGRVGTVSLTFRPRLTKFENRELPPPQGYQPYAEN